MSRKHQNKETKDKKKYMEKKNMEHKLGTRARRDGRRRTSVEKSEQLTGKFQLESKNLTIFQLPRGRCCRQIN
jgi:hypothetical protein